ncbi:MAG: serine protease, partial [Planctomycetota bacterium]
MSNPHIIRRRILAELRLASALAIGLAILAPSAAGQGRLDWVGEAQRKVVKVYGAGGLRSMEAYQSGLLVSPTGLVVTAIRFVVVTYVIVVVFADGRRFTAEWIGSDPLLELAVLRIPLEQDGLPYYDLEAVAVAEIGDRVLALSNLFGIAVGDEPVSALQGVVSAIAPLNGRRGAFQANYTGEVYVIDAHANNPGAAGGALVDWQGRLIGVLGKEL